MVVIIEGRQWDHHHHHQNINTINNDKDIKTKKKNRDKDNFCNRTARLYWFDFNQMAEEEEEEVLVSLE